MRFSYYTYGEDQGWTKNFSLIHQFTPRPNTHHVCEALFSDHTLLVGRGSISVRLSLSWLGEGYRVSLGVLSQIFSGRVPYAQVPRELGSHAHSCMTGNKKLSTKNNQHFQKRSGVSSESVPGKLLL